MRVVPMIFNSEMVKALLDGRKTATRRPDNFENALKAMKGAERCL